MKLFFFFACFLLSRFSTAQLQIEHGLVGSSAVREYTFFSPNAQPGGRVPYDIVRGSAFSNDNWQLATFYKGKYRVATLPARLNLATHEIHYMQNGEELVVQPVSGITSFVFHPGNDTSKVSATYWKAGTGLAQNNSPLEGFFRQLNDGAYKLLKYTDRRLIEGDSLHGTYKRYFFKDENHYFFQTGQTTTPVKKLNSESVLALLPQSPNLLAWMKEQKLNLKKEDDVVRFLAHYNATQSAVPR